MKTRKAAAAVALVLASLTAPATVAFAGEDPDVDAPDVDTEADATDEKDEDDDTGLWGLAGLLGLIGLAGLAKRKDHDHTGTVTGRVPLQPPTTGGASSGRHND